jgi:hypothetical protein
MKYFSIVLLCAVTLFSCVSTPQYNTRYIDSGVSILQVDCRDFGSTGIWLDITNISKQPVTLLFSESVILHDNIEDGLYIESQPDTIALSPSNHDLQPNETLRDSFHPRSYVYISGYSNFKPNIYHHFMNGSFSMILYYRIGEEKHSYTLNFDKL